MSRLRALYTLAGICICLAAIARIAVAGGAQWPTYKGSLTSYAFSSHLPMPFVVYKYGADGTLDGIFISRDFEKSHGNAHPSVQELLDMHDKMRQFIILGNVSQPKRRQLDAYSKALAQFLADQGYKIDKLVHNDRTYTLLLAEADLSHNTCPRITSELQGNLHAIHDAIQAAPRSQSYAVVQLVLGGNIRFRCN